MPLFARGGGELSGEGELSRLSCREELFGGGKLSLTGRLDREEELCRLSRGGSLSRLRRRDDSEELLGGEGLSRADRRVSKAELSLEVELSRLLRSA